MAGTIRNLHVLAYAQGFTLWVYRARDHSLAEFTAPGYFNSVGDVLATGDMINASARDGGSVLWVNSACEVKGVVVTELASTAATALSAAA